MSDDFSGPGHLADAGPPPRPSTLTRRSLRLAPYPVPPSPTSQLQEAGICPARLACRTPSTPRLSFSSTSTLTASRFFKKASQKVRSSSSQTSTRSFNLLASSCCHSRSTLPRTGSFHLPYASSRFVLFFSSDTASFLCFPINGPPGINLLAHSTSQNFSSSAATSALSPPAGLPRVLGAVPHPPPPSLQSG
ncbi:hypothetical protein CRENBAI_004038 [Crenichthys baileyi]|uniref:Uncharacterized protein n=1 Tax=Crenichthys baileyi TaxID=28760 RepID=A0AAV9QST1_9TELE